MVVLGGQVNVGNTVTVVVGQGGTVIEVDVTVVTQVAGDAGIGRPDRFHK